MGALELKAIALILRLLVAIMIAKPTNELAIQATEMAEFLEGRARNIVG